MMENKQVVLQVLPGGINLNLKFDRKEEVSHTTIKGKNVSSKGNI